MVCDSLTLLVAAYGACAACEGFGFARNTATTLDVFYWLQVTNFMSLSFLIRRQTDWITLIFGGCASMPNYLVAMFVLG
jgi:hypothetical protein